MNIIYIEILIILGIYGIIIFLGEYLSRFISPFISRKIAHILCGILSAILPLFLSFAETSIILIILITLVFITKYFNIFARLELSEKKNWGTIYFPFGLLLTALLFWNYNKVLFTIASLILGFADPLAAIIGKKLGKRKFFIFSNKTIEGSITFFITTIVIIFTSLYKYNGYYNLNIKNIILIIFGSLLVTGVEASSYKGTDNILIPTLSAAVLSFII